MALFDAAKGGDNDRLVSLLGGGTDPCQADTDGSGNTALHWGAFWGHAESCKVLLQHGVAANSRSADQSTPLHMAAAQERRTATHCELLLKHGVAVDAEDHHLATPLHVSAATGSCEAAKMRSCAGLRARQRQAARFVAQ